jgi:undecaprenyl-diphosphatase
MAAPLVSRRWRGPAAVVAVLCAVATISFGIALHGGMRTGFDDWAFRTLDGHGAWQGRDASLGPSEPAVSFTVITIVAVAAALTRRWRLVALSVAGPVIAVVLTEYVVKPAVHRVMAVPVPGWSMYTGTTAYPSGHETGVASAAALVLVAVGQVAVRPGVRAAVVAALVGWVAVAAAGLVRNGYHYATDTFGAAGLSFAVVVGVAMAVDTAGSRVRPRERQLT